MSYSNSLISFIISVEKEFHKNNRDIDSFLEKCTLPVDVGFVLDASGSILTKQFQLLKNFIKNFAERNDLSMPGLHIGVVLFSSSSSVAIKLTDFYDIDSFKQAVQNLPQEGSITRIGSALKTAYDKLFTKEYGARENVPQILILLTDGKQTRRYNYIEPSIPAKSLLNSGVLIKAIGVGSCTDRQELESITGSEKEVFMVRYFASLFEEKFFEQFSFNCNRSKDTEISY